MRFFNVSCFLLLSTALLLAINSQIITVPLATIVLALMAATSILLLYNKGLWRRLRNFTTNHNRRIIIFSLAVIIILGLLARFAPLLFGWKYSLENDLGDASVHYYAAQQLSHGALESNILEYERIYPYLYPYSLVLSVFYRIFNNIVLATLFSNTVLDIIGAIFVYLLIRGISNKRAAVTGFTLYLINPLSIVMCWMTMNVVLVNTILCAVLYLLMTLLKYMRSHKAAVSCILAIITGVLICIGNLFRPVFSVFLVVFLLCVPVAFTVLSQSYKQGDHHSRSIRNTLALIALPSFALLSSFALSSTVTDKAVISQLGNNSSQIMGGWSFYVGSNYTTSGAWSRDDSLHFFSDVIPSSTSIDNAQTTIMNEGLARYRQLSPLQFINHIANKLNVLFGDSGNSIHDLHHVFQVDLSSWKYRLLQSLVALFFTSMLLASIFFTWKSIGTDTPAATTGLSIPMLQLALLGLTAGFLLVEVMNRYSSIFYPILIIMAALLMNSKWTSIPEPHKPLLRVKSSNKPLHNKSQPHG